MSRDEVAVELGIGTGGIRLCERSEAVQALGSVWIASPVLRFAARRLAKTEFGAV